MKMATLLRILTARWLVIAGVAGIAILIAAVVTFVTPRSYTATTELIVDGKGQDPVSGELLPTRLLSGYIATQADIIRSRNVARKVIDQQKLLKHPALAEDFGKLDEDSARQALLGFLSNGLTVVPKRDSSVLSISFNARDPALAAQIADGFAQAYIQTNLELRIEPAKQITQWYDQQLASLRDNLIEKQDALSAYQEEHNILASNDRLDLENARLAELSSMLIAAQGERLTSQSRSDQVKDAKRGVLPAQVMDNPQVLKLSGELAEAQSRLTELGNRVGENHPLYQQTKGEVNGLQRQLNQTISLVSGSLRSSVELSQTREEQLRAELAAQKERVLQIDRNRNQLTLLKQEADNAQAAYDAALARASQTKLESRVALTDVAVLNTAAVPTRPTSPKPAMNLLLATLVGVLAGMALAIAWEWIDRRIRSVDDFEYGLGLPVLAYIPAERTARFSKEVAV